MKLERYSTEKEKLAAVKEDGFAIQYIKNPSEKVQLAAVKRNRLAIRYIKNPSEEVQLEAVKQDGDALQYIKTNDDEIILTALETANEDSIWEFLVNNDYETFSDEVKLAIQLK